MGGDCVVTQIAWSMLLLHTLYDLSFEFEEKKSSFAPLLVFLLLLLLLRMQAGHLNTTQQ